MTGVNKKDTVEISEILAGDFEGKTVKVNGAVHTIRDMGECYARRSRGSRNLFKI